MRFLKIIVMIFCGVFVVNCVGQGSVLHDTKGNPIQVSQLKGKWVIINVWAPWCDSCIKEIPALNDFYQHNQDKNIVLYGVDYDRLPLDELQMAIDKMHIAYPVILEDPTEIWPLTGIDALPVTFIINPDGKVVKKILGANTEKTLLDAVHELQK